MFNVCRGINGFNECGASSGACQLKLDDSTFHKSLGTSGARPSIAVDGALTLEFTGGDPCHDSQYTRSATVVFECLEGTGLGRPVFVTETADCEYVFQWATAAACGEPIESTCGARDPDTGKIYDLSPLTLAPSAKLNYVVKVQAKQTVPYSYTMNVCADLVSADNNCRPGVSICQVDPTDNQPPRSLGSVPKIAGKLTRVNVGRV